MCTVHNFAIMCDYELLLKTQFVLDWTMFIQGHSAVSIRLLIPIHMGPYCHCAVSIRVLTTPCTSPCCHSAVSIMFLLPLYMYKSLLQQCCVNKVFYFPSTCTSPYCHSVNKVFYYASTCTSPYCHSAMSIRVPTTPLHVQVLAPQCCVN